MKRISLITLYRKCLAEKKSNTFAMTYINELTKVTEKDFAKEKIRKAFWNIVKLFLLSKCFLVNKKLP